MVNEPTQQKTFYKTVKKAITYHAKMLWFFGNFLFLDDKIKLN
jgi:hypothetical protein